jgi:hypothetical protein
VAACSGRSSSCGCSGGTMKRVPAFSLAIV